MSAEGLGINCFCWVLQCYWGSGFHIYDLEKSFYSETGSYGPLQGTWENCAIVFFFSLQFVRGRLNRTHLFSLTGGVMPLYPHKLLHIHPTASRKKCQGRDFAHKRSKKVSSSDDRWCAQLSEGMYGFFCQCFIVLFHMGQVFSGQQ